MDGSEDIRLHSRGESPAGDAIPRDRQGFAAGREGTAALRKAELRILHRTAEAPEGATDRLHREQQCRDRTEVQPPRLAVQAARFSLAAERTAAAAGILPRRTGAFINSPPDNKLLRRGENRARPLSRADKRRRSSGNRTGNPARDRGHQKAGDPQRLRGHTVSRDKRHQCEHLRGRGYVGRLQVHRNLARDGDQHRPGVQRLHDPRRLQAQTASGIDHQKGTSHQRGQGARTGVQKSGHLPRLLPVPRLPGRRDLPLSRRRSADSH